MADKNEHPEITIVIDAVPDKEGKHVLTAHITVTGGDPKQVAQELTDVVKILVAAGILIDWGGGGP